jgi:hypothetical protein
VRRRDRDDPAASHSGDLRRHPLPVLGRAEADEDQEVAGVRPPADQRGQREALELRAQPCGDPRARGRFEPDRDREEHTAPVHEAEALRPVPGVARLDLAPDQLGEEVAATAQGEILLLARAQQGQGDHGDRPLEHDAIEVLER